MNNNTKLEEDLRAASHRREMEARRWVAFTLISITAIICITVAFCVTH